MQYLKDEIKNRILEVAIKEFHDKGFLGASIRDIAKNSGIAIGNVYRYFKSKEDMFNEIVEPAYRWFFCLEEHGKPVEGNYSSIFEEVVNSMMEVLKKNQIQILILADKSKGTKYSDFKERIIRSAQKRMEEDLLPVLQKKGINIKNIFIFYIIASTFTEGLFIILRKYNEEEEIKYLIHQLIILHFENIENRFE